MYTVNERDVGSAGSRVSNLSSVEDVATLLDTYERAMGEVSYKNISGVLATGRGYVFVVKMGFSGSFDLYSFINEKYRGNEEVNCVNARLLFPSEKSRLVSGIDFVDEEEDTPTGFMDEQEFVTGNWVLVHDKLGIRIPITLQGTVVGRSSKQSSYVVQGNGNVSRRHARVYRKDNALYLENYQPPNGTFVNGRKLKDGDVVRLSVGDYVMLADESFSIE